MDSDLEEIDIREAFTIFDNVSLLKFKFPMRQSGQAWFDCRMVTATSPGQSWDM